MEIYTIGFTKWRAEDFFGSLARAGVKRVLDVRISNRSHLAGFSKGGDLPYFLRELVGAAYEHHLELAPREDLFRAYRAKELGWDEYAARYLELIEERRVLGTLDRTSFTTPTALLCTEHTAEGCHRRLAAEALAQSWTLGVIHL